MISCVLILCFLLWNLFILCLIIFSLNKVSLNSLNSVTTFTPFTVLDSLPSIVFIECIFDFNRTNSPVAFPSNTSFILPITFTGRIKKLWIFWRVTEIKFFINIFWFYFISKTLCVSKQQFSIKILFNISLETANFSGASG